MQPLTLISLIHFAGIALGLLLVLLLLTRSVNVSANRWLAAFVSCLALLWTGDLLEETHTVLVWPWASHTTDWLIFLLGPCLWMYVRRLTGLQTPSFLVWLVHAVPAAIIVYLLMPFYLTPAATKVDIIARELAEHDDSLNLPLLAAVIQAVGYWIACLIRIRRVNAALRDQYSSFATRNLSWLNTMLLVTLGMWMLWAANIVLHAPWSHVLHTITVVPGLYVLAFLGLRESGTFAAASGQLGDAPGTRRYVRSGLDGGRVSELVARLEAVMKMDKPWLESDLTLAELATRCGCSTHNLSQILNGELGSSFFDYVNSRRVEEVKRCLLDPAYASQTILEIAHASGFSSKTAFNTAFRQYAHVTPSEFRRQTRSGLGAQPT